jgi:hypothetical protein
MHGTFNGAVLIPGQSDSKLIDGAVKFFPDLEFMPKFSDSSPKLYSFDRF